jgi:PAS domain S-box-containing protein
VPRKKSIQQVILGQTFPTLILLAAVSFIALLIGIYVTVTYDIEKRHTQRVEKVTQSYQVAIENQIKLLNAAAENKFVIDALNYSDLLNIHLLKEHLASLNYSNLKYADISVYSSNGDTLATNKPLTTAVSKSYDTVPWFNQVFIQQSNYYRANSTAIVFAIPIVKNGQLIGALAAEYSSLEPFLLFNFEDSVVLITDASQRILYTSDRNNFTPFSILDWSYIEEWRLAYQSTVDDLTIIGIERSNIYYQDFYKLLTFAVISLAFIFISSIISTRAAGKLAAQTIDQFIGSLQHVIRTETDDGYKFKLPYVEAAELQQLSSEFQHLLKNLTESNLSKKRVSALMNSLNDLLVTFDLDGNIDLSNKAFDAFLESTGIAEDSVISSIFTENNASKLLNASEAFSEVEKRYLVRTHHGDNPFRTIRWTRHVLTDEEQRITGITFVGMDTTHSSALETEIRLKEAAIDGADSGIFIAEFESNFSSIIYANKGVEKLSSLEHQFLLGTSSQLLTLLLSNKAAYENIQSATRRGEPVVEVLQWKRKDHSTVHVEMVLSPVRLQVETNKNYYLGILKDVTEQQLTAKLLIEAKQRAEESTQMKSSFLASMSHEIRTPMNGVMGMLDILNESQLDPQQKNYLGIAQNSAESLLTIINDILDFSKIEAGKLEVDQIDFNLSDMLDGFVDSMAHQAHAKRLELILDSSDIDRQTVKGDPGRLRQIMTNLVNNAIKFTDHGEIVIRAGLSEVDDDKLLLSMTISDTGIGIPHEKQARLFDPFTQVDGSHKRERQGTGLGLAIVKQLCEAMHGHIWMTSQPEKGSTFGFRIQLATSKKERLELPTFDLQKKNILIVDDNENNCKVLQKQLTKWNVTSSYALGGEAGLAVLEENEARYDALLVDMNMPGFDGATFGQLAKKVPSYEDVKLVLMTSISQRGDAQHFATLGFDGYFPKPATTSDLIDTLSILFDDGAARDEAEPLVTQHYVRSLRHDQSFTKAFSVLLVEDNPVNQMISKKYIEKLGLKSTIAPDGEQAITMMRDTHTQFDLVLMDCQMPVLDGFEATRKIRMGEAGDRYLNVPIIAMTANAMKGDREHCLEVGMDDYISKPLKRDVLNKTLKSWLGRL